MTLLQSQFNKAKTETFKELIAGLIFITSIQADIL